MHPSRAETRFSLWQSKARAAGVKLTHQRLALFRVLAANEDHPTAEAVFRAVRPQMPTVSLDTVYRTLWLLHELGLIETLGQRQEGMRFDVNHERHHHFVCTACGLVRDFESDALHHQPLPEAVRALGAVIEARVEVRGVCAACQNKPPSSLPTLTPTPSPTQGPDR